MNGPRWKSWFSRERLGRDLRMAMVALVVSGLVVATPSVAARVTNADKVDGKDAVSASAPVARRRGKLVATDRTGRLPGNIIRRAPDAARLGGTPSTGFRRRTATRGSVQSGLWSAWGGGAGSLIGDAVTFTSTLPAGIPASRTTYLLTGAPATPQCPGVGRVVPVGWACFYEMGYSNRGSATIFDAAQLSGPAGVGRTGFVLWYDCASTSCWSYGTWSVKAGPVTSG